MRHSKRALLGATILASITLLTSTGASAQDAPLTPLGRIVLGGTANGEIAIDTPQAVTVINQEEIDRAQATTVGELFDLVPGVQAIGSGRVAGESFNVRGIGSSLSSDESRIIVTVDGATKFYEQYRLGSFFSDPELYRQVEVLRGPASSTLYGSGALGGVINFETKDASDFLTDSNNAVRTRLSYGSNNDEFLSSVIFATRPTESFETLFSLNYREAGDYSSGDGTVISGSEFDALSGLVKSRLRFGDNLEQSLTFSYSQWNSDLNDTALEQTETSTFADFGTIDREINDRTLAVRYENPFRGNNLLDLDVELSYSDTDNNQDDPQGASAVFGPPGTPATELSCEPGQNAILCPSDYSYETTTLRVENTSELGGANYDLFLTSGIQLSHQDRVAQNEINGVDVPAEFHPEGTDQRIGVYAQGEFIFDNGLTLIPGIRADFIQLTSGDVDFADFDETVISPKLAAHYEINETYAIFGSVARTERAPTLDELFSFTPAGTLFGVPTAGEPNSPDLTAETAVSYEFGASASYLGIATSDDALDIKATAFFSDIDDLIARDSTEGTPYNRNIDQSEIYGIEIEAAYESDRVFGRLAYADVRGTDLETDETLSSIPARNLHLTIGGRNEDVGLEYGWEAAIFDSIETEEGEFSGYAEHDIFVDWEPQDGGLEGFEVSFRVNNLFDREFQNNLAGDPGQGRSYEISLARTYEF